MPKRGRPYIYGEEETLHTGFQCPKSLMELIRIKAKKDRRSVCNYIIRLMEKDVEGMELPKPAPTKAKRSR